MGFILFVTTVKGVLYPEIYSFNINFFGHNFYLKMCIYTLKKQTFKNNFKIPQGGCATPPNVPKLGDSGVKDTANTNKD